MEKGGFRKLTKSLFFIILNLLNKCGNGVNYDNRVRKGNGRKASFLSGKRSGI